MSYPSQQAGDSLTGTITTDGTIGALAGGDILSWQYTIRSAGGSVRDTENQTNGITGSAGFGNVVATPTTLTIPSSGVLNLSTEYAPNQYIATIELQNTSTPFYIAVAPPVPGTVLWETSNPALPASGASTWIIATATVPEPNSLLLALLGIACLATVLWTRRYRGAACRPQVTPSAGS